MSYYYKVALMLDKDGIDSIKSNLVSLKNNKLHGWSYVNLEWVRNSLCHKIDLLLNNADKHYIDNKSSIEIRYWEKLGWYDVNTRENLDLNTIWYYLERMDSIHYKYISIGKDPSDIEIKGSLCENPFNLKIIQTIHIEEPKKFFEFIKR